MGAAVGGAPAVAAAAAAGVAVGDLPEFVFNSPLILQNPISLNFPRTPDQRERAGARPALNDPEVAEEDEDEEEEA